MAKRISEKEEKFCVEVVTGVDDKGGSITITEAHRRAYPSDKMSEKTRVESASRVMNRTHVQERIADLRAQLAEKAVIDKAYVLSRLVEIDQMDAIDILNDDGTIKPVRDWPKVWRQYLSGMDVAELSSGGDNASAVMKKIKWPDKVKNLELIGKAVGAFVEKVEHSSPDGTMTPQATIIISDEELKQKLTELGFGRYNNQLGSKVV